MRHIKKVLCIQSVGDLITNSSSEVYITDYLPALPRGESWCYLIDRDFMLRRNEDDAFFVWKYLKEKYGLENPIEFHYIKPDEPDELEFVFSSSMEKFGERKTNRHYMEIFDKFVQDHQELKVLLDGNHYLVSLSDHDDDYWDYYIEGELVEDH